MSKIVIDAREYTTSTGRYMFRLLQYLEKLETKNEYVILLNPEDMDVYDYKNPRWRKVATTYKAFTFGEQLGFARQIASMKPDLVHFGMDHQPVLYRGKTVTTMHDLTTTRFVNPDKNRTIFTIKQWVYRWVTWRVAHKSTRIITPSEYVKNDIIDYAHIPGDKITVTYEAADPITDAPTPLPALKNKQFIMYVGRPTPHKNLERLIEAFEQLQAQHPDLVLVLAGKKDGNYRRIEAGVQAKGITNVHFTDFVTEGELRWLYEHCAAYVFPSLSEGFGLPALEAMAHGAPVVSSNATCLPEVYGQAAYYFDPLSFTDMAHAIDDVLTNDRLRNKLIAAGKKQVAKYSWQRMAEQTLQVYKSALKK